MAYYYWGQISNFVYTSSGSIDDALWSRGNAAGGTFPLWTWTETAASTYQSGASLTYNIYLTGQNFVLDSEPAVLVASVDLVSPFSKQGNLSSVMSFNRVNGIVNGGVLWTEWDSVAGAIDIAYRPFTFGSSATIVPPATSGIALTGSKVTISSDITGLAEWSTNWTSTNFVFGYMTATSTPSGTVRNVYFQAFDTSGNATSPLVEVASNVAASTVWNVSYTNSTWYYEYTKVDGTNTGLWRRTFDSTTGALGPETELQAQTSFTKFFGYSYISQLDGSKLYAFEGMSNGSHVLEISRVSAGGTPLGVTATYTLPGTSGVQWRMIGNVWDSSNGSTDLNALTYLVNGQIHLVILDSTGAQVGSDFVLPTGGDVFGLGKMRMTGTRLQIPYSISDPNGGYDEKSLIYDFAGGPVVTTIFGTSQWAGTSFDDIFTDAPGAHLVAGGSGNDTFATAFTSNLVHVSTTAQGDVEVITPYGTTFLEDFEKIELLNGTIGISGTQLTPALNPGLGLRATNPYDFNGDGMSDALLRNGTGVTYLWTMNGATVSNGATTSVQVGNEWQIKGVGDFDGNGTSDLLWLYENAANPADGLNGVSYISFQNGATATDGGVVQQLSGWSIAGIGDFDGDGKSDVLYRSDTTGQTYIDFMQSNQIDWNISGFTSDVVSDSNWTVAAVADFNGDGDADVLWRYANAADAADPLNGTLYEWQMNGKLAISSGLLSQQASGAWQVAGTGDFNGDGRADLLFRYHDASNAADPLNGVSYIDFMDGTTVVSGATTGWQVDESWQVASIGDYDGNGKADILWQKASTGDTFLWTMNGSSVTSGAFTSAQAGSGWTVQNGVLVG